MRLNSPQINLITKACMKASRSLIRDFGEIENLQVSSKGPGDFVTSADKRTEKILVEELQKAHPEYGIITEETGIINKSNTKNRWIIDPIDGTFNFMNGIPQFAISIGYEEENEIKCGVIFNPISNVSWNVDPIATSTEGQERLTMTVESNGATKPKDAMNHSANILRQQMQFFMFDDSLSIKAVNDDEINEALQLKNILSKTIDEMELSVRSHNCLQAAGIYKISELVSKEESQMLKYKNFGRKSLTELVEKLGQLGLSFGMDISELMESE